MKGLLNSLLLIPSLISSLAGIWRFNSVHSSYHRRARKFLVNVTSGLDLEEIEGFPKNGLLKMQWYIAEFIYVCQSFNGLHGKKASVAEKESYCWAGILLTICDLVIDDIPLPDHRLELYKSPKENLTPENDLEKLYLIAYSRLLESLNPRQVIQVLRYFQALFDAQIDSKKQFQSDISTKEVDDIARKKCGYSMLFMRALTSAELTPQEEQAIMELGAFVQYANDTQDMRKDYKNGIRSFATCRTDLQDIAESLSAQYHKASDKFANLPLEKSKIKQFRLSLFLMHQGIKQKIRAFERLCNGEFAHEKLSQVPKSIVRKETNWWRISKYAIPKALWFNDELTMDY